MRFVLVLLLMGACAHTNQNQTTWTSFSVPGTDSSLVETDAPPVEQPWKAIWQWKQDGIQTSTQRNIQDGDNVNQAMTLTVSKGTAWRATVWSGRTYLPDSLWVLHLKQLDVDRDGKLELLIRYRISGEEEPALGAAVEERLAIHAMDTGKQQLDLRVATHRGDDQYCVATINTGDVNQDDHPDLQVHWSCDDPAKNSQTTWRYQPANDRWLALR
jgi:hypothetical protein